MSPARACPEPSPFSQWRERFSDSTQLKERLDAHLDQVVSADAAFRILLPEPGRRGRLNTLPLPNPGAPLAGLPFGVKDVFAVSGFETRAGSALPAALLERAEATAVRRCIDAGAVVLGKTVTTEFAYREPGATSNPHNPAHTPGGSSSGSAAAVAAGICAFALGTQTMGSVIRPAAYCGVVGFKGSHGRVPTDGVIAYSRSADHVGLFATDVAGARAVASCLLDAWQEGRCAASDIRLGVADPATISGLEPPMARAMADLLDAAPGDAFRMAPVSCPPGLDDVRRIHEALTSAEFAAEYRDLFAAHASRLRPATLAMFDHGRALDPGAIAQGRESMLSYRQRMHDWFDAAGIDALVFPAATGPAPRGLAWTGDPSMNIPWTHAGLPCLGLPVGYEAASGGALPIAVQLIARHGDDEKLFAIGQAFERNPARR